MAESTALSAVKEGGLEEGPNQVRSGGKTGTTNSVFFVKSVARRPFISGDPSGAVSP